MCKEVVILGEKIAPGKSYQIKIDIALNDGMATLEASLTELAEKQLLELEADPNVSVQDIADRKMKSIN